MRAYRHPVIISFGHEMNGNWYSWGYQHTLPGGVRGRLAAHRHRVPRSMGASNVTWLWTVNIIDTQSGKIPPPARGGPAAPM